MSGVCSWETNVPHSIVSVLTVAFEGEPVEFFEHVEAVISRVYF